MATAFLSAPRFDIYGYTHLPLMVGTPGDKMNRRSNMVETLDGSVALNDRGYSDAGHTFVLRWRADPRVDGVVAYLVRSYSRLVLAHPNACYECAASDFQSRASGDISRVTLMILARLSA